MKQKFERLLNGETFVTVESGNSMTPRIYHRQPHRLAPCSWDQVEIDDVVYAKVNGRFLTHLVVGICQKRGVQLANLKGHVNGWTKKVYGKVIEILPMNFKEN